MLSCLELLACTQYHIASLLATNNFNTVWLPVIMDHILKNTKLNKGMISTFTNQALVVTDYLSLLKSIIKVLQFHRIGVLTASTRLRPRTTAGSGTTRASPRPRSSNRTTSWPRTCA